MILCFLNKTRQENVFVVFVRTNFSETVYDWLGMRKSGQK